MATQSSEIKESVKQKYSKIARDAGGCCGPAGCCEGGGEVFNMMNESYAQLAGYTPDADLSLGCGIPVKTAELKPGQHVLDLGSGAGNDIFVARSVVGTSGQLTGLDFSEDMLAKARRNQQKLGYENIRFVQGDIEAMPLEAHQFDVVLSNCVLNLVPDKKAAFAEIFRVLRPGGHFTISDIVLEGQLSDWMLKSAELYA
ncbi:MAG: methyltransferase domain-containing protein, partial [Cyclonatronaceae bacterium]